MCQGDDPTVPMSSKSTNSDVRVGMAKERRAFLKSTFAATGGAAALATTGISLVSPALRSLPPARQPGQQSYYHLPANADTVHWGYFSKLLKPQVEVNSGDLITIETLTHQASDDAERMINGDPGQRASISGPTEEGRHAPGAGPGDGGGLGVHICTGPVAVRGAEPGDVLEVRILDVKPRPSANPEFKGLAFGSNAAANWGFQYKDLITGDKPREVVTIYEVDATGDRNWAKAVYNFKWIPVTDPTGQRASHDRLSGTDGRPYQNPAELGRAEEYPRADPPAFRNHGPGAKGSRLRQLDPAELHRRQYRQLAYRQRGDDVLPGRCAGRIVVGW